ncbi:hypothetical protein [Spirosoma sordidisoli]|uniref:Uncharacterized protein n=1 Tax=Spirosoma sordidisoli TaxID=2502893 RepID=A0A4V1RWP8_9BACT|nr:hypothetical protein [Spirosoma sordidisoli]RYC71018.1 hypothetical protein EQG79_02400 [Spirosoma sordidisoli]
MSQLSTPIDLQTDVYPSTPAPATPTPAVVTTPTSRPDRKKLAGISAAALLLGGASWVVSRAILAKQNSQEPSVGGNPPGTDVPSSIELPAELDVAGTVTDAMPFEQAFEVARQEVGFGGVFSWHGHWYSTFEQAEWSSLSLAQRHQFAEMITQEQLPVKPYADSEAPVAATPSEAGQDAKAGAEPTVIEGHMNGQRVMGIDYDQDGVIDTLVMEGADGHAYRVVDASGDEGLDTLLRYDSLDGELVEIKKIDDPFVLSNDQFSQGLEASMSKEIVDSILEPTMAPVTPAAPTDQLNDASTEPDEVDYVADAHEPDDTYVNNGDVSEMDE